MLFWGLTPSMSRNCAKTPPKPTIIGRTSPGFFRLVKIRQDEVSLIFVFRFGDFSPAFYGVSLSVM